LPRDKAAEMRRGPEYTPGKDGSIDEFATRDLKWLGARQRAVFERIADPDRGKFDSFRIADDTGTIVKLLQRRAVLT
jgi:hypothetical protein